MQWSCRLRPTGSSWRTAIPNGSSSSASPIPESISSTGDWYAPPETITSRSARTVSRTPFRTSSTPTARSPSNTSRSTKTPGRDLQVRPPLGRVEEPVGGAAAQAVPLGELEARDALRAVDVQVVDVLVAGLHGGLEHQVGEPAHRAAVGHRERAADAVELVLAALVVLGALEVGQHLVVRPARAAVRRPPVEVGAVAAQVDHRVDRARASDHATARQVEPSTAEARLGLAEQVPVQARLEDDGNIAGTCSSGAVSGPPASSSSTVTSGSSLRRAASTQPAVPAPTIT